MVIAHRTALFTSLLALSVCAGAGAQEVADSNTTTSVQIPESLPPDERIQVPPTQSNYGRTTIYGEAVSKPFTEVPLTGEEAVPIIDRTQKTVYNVVNNSSLWFDSFFGSSNVNEQHNVSRGSVTLGAQWDQRDGIDPIARMRARIPLDALKARTRLVFGRGNVNEFVDGSADDVGTSLPSQFNDFEDDEWLLGVGYSKNGDISSGFDFDFGVKIASPLEPYVRTTYRWNHTFSDAVLWQLRPRAFWQNQRGVGGSVNSILDYAVNPTWLLRSWIILSAEEEIKGLGWTNSFIAYQSLTNKKALSYRLYATGATDAEVELQNYGFELRYRKRISRDFLFMELSTSVSWPRYYLEETRESNFGIGLAIELQFGDWPGRKQEN
jgi:hypothetical protein